MDWKARRTHHIYDHINGTELLSGPIEVAYPALSSGYEKHFVEALRTLGTNLASEPVLCLSTFMRIVK